MDSHHTAPMEAGGAAHSDIAVPATVSSEAKPERPAETDKVADSGAPSQPQEQVQGHIQTAERVPLFPMGDASERSMPSVDFDDQFSDMDSAMGTFKSSTMSITSSIYNTIEEDGRTYHSYKAGKYHLPNDLEEQDRLDLQHAIFLMTTAGKLLLAPVGPHVRSVLDIGTGTGIWAIEFAQDHPGADVLGTDLSPIQPKYLPPNCRFEIDDADDEWTFGPRFDLIHARAMVSCFSDKKKVIQSCYDALVPGGWCEWQDMLFPLRHVGPIPEGTVIIEWSEMIAAASEKIGRPWKSVGNYKRYFEEVGFTNVVERTFYWPIGYPWARGEYYKNIAVYFTEDVKRAMDPVTRKLFPLLGLSREEIEVLNAKVRLDMENPKIHAYLPILFVYGQKPET